MYKVQATGRGVRWEYLVEPAVRYHKTAAYDIPNQYVRILRWIHLTGEELLEMDAPPYELLPRLHDKEYANNPNIPTDAELADLKTQYGDAAVTGCPAKLNYLPDAPIIIRAVERCHLLRQSVRKSNSRMSVNVL